MCLWVVCSPISKHFSPNSVAAVRVLAVFNGPMEGDTEVYPLFLNTPIEDVAILCKSKNVDFCTFLYLQTFVDVMQDSNGTIK